MSHFLWCLEDSLTIFSCPVYGWPKALKQGKKHPCIYTSTVSWLVEIHQGQGNSCQDWKFNCWFS